MINTAFFLAMAIQQQPPTTLADCRKEIDKQDAIIVKALEQRFFVVEQVGKIKNQKAHSSLDLHINPKRESEIIKSVTSQTIMPSDTIDGIWRNIISTANRMEQQIEVVYDSTESQIETSKYYPMLYKEQKPDQARAVQTLLNPTGPTIGGFLISNNWWYDLFVLARPPQDNLQIFKISGKTAFVGYIQKADLVQNRAIIIIPTKQISSEHVELSRHKDMSLVITANKNTPGMLVGLVE